MQTSGALRRENAASYLRKMGRAKRNPSPLRTGLDGYRFAPPILRTVSRDNDITRGSRRHHRNPGAVAAAHQHAILGLAEIGDADREPDADRGQRHGERERCDIGKHAMTEIVGLVAGPLVAGQIIGRGRRIVLGC